MEISIFILQAFTSIVAMFAGAYIYRKGIQGESVLPEQKKINKSASKDWAEI